MEADSQHVCAEPGPAANDIAKYGQNHDPSRAGETCPFAVENDGIPDDDKKCSIFFRVPAPESSPRLVCPNAPKDSAHKAELGGKANDAVNHASECAGGLLVDSI